jgi:glycerophosphoryl diester phosphodiesterase
MHPSSASVTSPATSASVWPYPTVVAHRGGGTLAPENTLEAIDTGARLGHRMIEFDARCGIDDIVFLLHDDQLARTTNGHGDASTTPWHRLQTLDAGSWFDTRYAGARIPTLADVADRCLALGLHANVEIKPGPGLERHTGQVVARDVLRQWKASPAAPLLSSFSYEALAAAAEVAPVLPRGMLCGSWSDPWREQTQALRCVSLHMSHKALTQERVAEIKDAGLFLLAYTVNDPSRAATLLEWGVDTICTDRIDLIGPNFGSTSLA